eukprot:SAG22_NODE_437_length_10501_cov_3.019804_16_plen_56_part_00
MPAPPTRLERKAILQVLSGGGCDAEEEEPERALVYFGVDGDADEEDAGEKGAGGS